VWEWPDSVNDIPPVEITQSSESIGEALVDDDAPDALAAVDGTGI
jgi:hypothetical protein